MFVSKHVTFLEKEFLQKESGGTEIELNEVQDPQIEAEEPIKPTTVELVDSTYEPPVIQAPRKSDRVRTEHEMYRF